MDQDGDSTFHSLATRCPHILDHILSYLPPPDLKSCRLVNSTFNSAAIPRLGDLVKIVIRLPPFGRIDDILLGMDSRLLRHLQLHPPPPPPPARRTTTPTFPTTDRSSSSPSVKANGIWRLFKTHSSAMKSIQILDADPSFAQPLSDILNKFEFPRVESIRIHEACREFKAPLSYAISELRADSLPRLRVLRFSSSYSNQLRDPKPFRELVEKILGGGGGKGQERRQLEEVGIKDYFFPRLRGCGVKKLTIWGGGSRGNLRYRMIDEIREGLVELDIGKWKADQSTEVLLTLPLLPQLQVLTVNTHAFHIADCLRPELLPRLEKLTINGHLDREGSIHCLTMGRATDAAAPPPLPGVEELRIVKVPTLACLARLEQIFPNLKRLAVGTKEEALNQPVAHFHLFSRTRKWKRVLEEVKITCKFTFQDFIRFFPQQSLGVLRKVVILLGDSVYSREHVDLDRVGLRDALLRTRSLEMFEFRGVIKRSVLVIQVEAFAAKHRLPITFPDLK